MPSPVTRYLAQFVIVILVVTVITGVLLGYFTKARAAAVDVKKKSELTSIYTLLQFYYVGENESPDSPSADGWCEINEFYGKNSCLEEVIRDGYVEALVQSPNDDKYLYYDDESKFFVATRMHKELSSHERCPYSDDPRMWCKVFDKEGEGQE